MNKPDTTAAIFEGIRHVGVGKKGSNDCTDELVASIRTQMNDGLIDPRAKGAFFGALQKKGVRDNEQELINLLSSEPITSSDTFTSALLPNVPTDIKSFAVSLSDGNDLTGEQVYTLGKYLFSGEADPAAQGYFASVLRVKYETFEEYCGLLDTMNEATMDLSSLFPNKAKLIQLAEPFDGMVRSHLITPLLADMLVKEGYGVVSLTGRNAGPKYGMNLEELATELGAPFISDTTPLKDTNASYYLKQQDVSPEIDKWIEVRRTIIKRPFLATLEKIVNPCCADIGFFSAFHGPYAEKMVDLALEKGFKAAFSVFRSMEGSLTLAPGRACQVYLGVKLSDGNIIKEKFTFQPEEFGIEETGDVKLDSVNAAENAQLVKKYIATGTSGDKYFDLRVQFTNAVYKKSLNWITAKLDNS